MELNINSPAYFNQHYGIVPVAAPRKLYDERAWKESVKQISNKSYQEDKKVNLIMLHLNEILI